MIVIDGYFGFLCMRMKLIKIVLCYYEIFLFVIMKYLFVN